MGFALAEEAAARGGLVELVTGPVNLQTDRAGITRTNIRSAAEMAEACKRISAGCDAVVMSAAIADYRPADPKTEKIKKKGGELGLQLEPTEDVLGWMGANKPQGQLLVGFALETNDGLAHAVSKLERKNLDLIVLNSLEDQGAGFGHDTNKVTLIAKGTKPVALPLMTKVEAAVAILDHLETLIHHA